MTRPWKVEPPLLPSAAVTALHPPHRDHSRRKHPITGWMYRLKDWTEGFATRPHAVAALFLLAFAESSFFPIPPDVLLIALCVAQPKRSFYFALACTVASVLGGLAGYAIGHFLWYDLSGNFGPVARLFFDHVPGFSVEAFEKVRVLYEEWNFWVVFTAGFTPIPYKLITITAGVFNIDLVMFTIASIAGRAGRFFLVGAALYWLGPRVQHFLEKYLEWLTLAFVVLLVAGFVVIKYAF